MGKNNKIDIIDLAFRASESPAIQDLMKLTEGMTGEEIEGLTILAEFFKVAFDAGYERGWKDRMKKKW